MSSYATFAGLQARLVGRTINDTSKPSKVQCQVWIDEGEALLKGTLASVGCSPETTQANGILLMSTWALDWAEGHARISFSSGDGGDRNPDGVALLEKFDKLLSDIIGAPNRFEIMLQGSGDGGRLMKSHVTDNKDDKSIDNRDFDPMFVNDQNRWNRW